MDKPLAIVSGASSGIGAATATALAGAGYRVVMLARGADALERARARAAAVGEAHAHAIDVSDAAAVTELAARVKRDHGIPEVVVNSAGAGTWRFLEEGPAEDGLAALRAPFLAAYHLSHAFMAEMLARRRGLLVHVGSPASRIPWPGATAYTCSRWALRGLHEALSQDLRGTGVMSSHVLFGKVTTEYFDHNPGSEERIPGVGGLIPEISSETAARVILSVVRRPRAQVLYPFLLRLFYWSEAVAPWLVRWLARRTSPVRRR
jgi:short-subunit dehydrogenase